VRKPAPIVVVGAGLAGLRACEGLRSRGYRGALVLVGEEPHLPYDRPPLSKQFLAGEWQPERVFLRTEAQVEELGLDLRLGPEHRAVGLDLDNRELISAGGVLTGFSGLVLSTGATPRRLSGVSELAEAHVLRTIDDAAGLREVISRPRVRLLLVGAGFIGLEVAATARRAGASVTVVEPLAVPLGRVLGPVAGRVVEGVHREHGVGFFLGTSLSSVDRLPGGELSCLLGDGTVLVADALLVGIGAVPAVGWLEGTGLPAGPDGVRCDAALVAAPLVVAAGDLARWPVASGGSVRVEHRTNAAEQGDQAAASLLAALAGVRPEPFVTVPYVWSDQYDLKIQALGLPEPDDEVVVVDGSVEEGRFLALYGRQGRLSAAVGFGRPRLLMRFRALLERGAGFKEARALQLG
jgi:3-phenylpropionate/trans-cinnamate dioxygenase ferredoxin reductase subunit